MISLIFWISFCGIIYPFAIFPLLLFILQFVFSKKVNKSKEFQPSITILIAAHNEEKYIEDCLNSILNSNYPKEKINIILGSDNSTDNTNNILNEFCQKNQNIKYYTYERIGKNAVINNLYQYVSTDYVFFIDADCRVQNDTISLLVANLADQNVGGAISSLKIMPVYQNNNTGESGEITYQGFEFYLRLWESKIWTISNALGSMYGMKKEIIEKMPNMNLADDFFNVLSTNLKKKRFIFEKDAVTIEVREKNLIDEIHRRERTFAGMIFTLIETKKLFNPLQGWSSFFMYSHKFLRLMMPFFILTCLLSSLFLDQTILINYYIIYFEILFIFMVILAYLFEKLKININFLKLPLFFVSLNYAYIIGIKKVFQKSRTSIWSH